MMQSNNDNIEKEFNMKQKIRLFVILCTVIFSLAWSAAGVLAASDGKVLRLALTMDPNALEPAMADERNAAIVSWCLYDSLVAIDDDSRVIPALAESWTINPEGTVFTFKLRKGVTFHNGEPFNADDVLFTWNRGKRENIKYKDRFNLVKNVEKLDEYTVRMSTENSSPLLLRFMAEHWAMLPAKLMKKTGEDKFLAAPVGTGPFKFVKWSKGDRIEFEANKNYWKKGFPKAEKVIFRPIPESSTRVAAIQAGEVDLVTRLSAEEVAGLKGDANVRVVSYPVDRVYYIAFNNMTSGKGLPTEDPRVRQAMNYAVDVQSMLDALFNGKGRPSTGFVTPGNLGFDKAIKPFGYNPAKAKALLKEAGYPDGFKIGFACPSGAYTNFQQVCEAIQGYWAEMGIIAELQVMESGKYWDLEAKKELPPLFGDSWSETIGEAMSRLQGALGGNSAAYSTWWDEKIGAMLDQIKGTVDEEKRAELYVTLQHYMQENPPFVYLYEPVTYEVVSSRVTDYKPRASEQYYLFETHIK